MKQHAWYQIDRKLEKEDKNKEDYIVSPKMKEISNIVMDFVSVISELNYLCLFSISFPISFLIAFGIGII